MANYLDDNAFRLVLSYEDDNGITQYVEFDRVDDTTVNSTSDVTNHPLVSGDMVADHMYRLPNTMSFAGTFNLSYGNQATIFEGAGTRLANIQELFEKIKNKGTFCTLTKMNKLEKSTTLFKVRKNMVLNGIRWVEKQNTLDFNFDFMEALTANVQAVDYMVDVLDENLPALTDPSTLSFTDTLLDWNQVDEMVVRTMIDVNLVKAEFIQYVVEVGQAGLAGLAVGGLVGIAAAVGVVLTIAAVAGTVPVAGWIAAGITAAAAAVVGLVYGIFKGVSKAQAQRKYKVNAFNLYNDDRKNQQEVERFTNYLGSIHQNIAVLNDYMELYGIQSNENQECMTYIDNVYYTFKFIRNNDTQHWRLSIEAMDKSIDKEITEVQGLANISECTRGNCLFRTTGGSGYWVYLLNPKLELLAQEGKENTEEYEEAIQDLTNYFIFVAKTDMENFKQTLAEIIDNAMMM